MNFKNILQIMKKFILVFSILITMISCNSDGGKYQINGSIEGINDGIEVTLKKIKDNKPVDIDTARVVNGKFTFNGTIDTPDMHLIFIRNVRGSLPFILENQNIELTLYKDSLYASKITGSKENDILQKYMDASKIIRDENISFRSQVNEARRKNDTAFLKEFNSKSLELKNKSNQFNKEFLGDNSEYLFSALLLESLLASKVLKTEEATEVINSFSKEVSNSAPGLRVKEKVNAELATAEGSIAPDFTAPDPDGKEITLSKIRGKVTIIDFWAAWCGPCRKENPNVVKVYEKYHDKGLEIIGVSLDGTPRQKNAKQAWLDAIEKDGLTWHQVSNLNYFNDPVAKQYNIRSIPATFILDSDGEIVAKNLRGPALEKKIAELLN